MRGAGCGGAPPPFVLLRAGIVGVAVLFAVVHLGWVLLLTLLLPRMLLLPRILPSLLPRHGREGGMMRKVHVLLVLAVLIRLLLLMKLRLLAVVVATSCRHTACPDRGTYV